MAKHSNEKIYYKHSFKLLFMFVIIVLFFLHTFNALRQFNASEPIPALEFNLPDQQLPFGNGVAIVKAGLYIKNFLEFNVKTSMFEIDGTLWFKFNPSLIPLEDIDDFKIINGFIVSKEALNPRLIDGQMLATYDVRIKFYSSLTHTYFPMNDHRVYLIIKNNRLTPSAIHYEVDLPAVAISESTRPFGWRPIAFDAWSGYRTNVLDHGVQKKIISFPSIIFALSFAKPGFSSVLVVLAPIFLLFLFGLLSLLIEKSPNLSLSTSIGSLSGLLVYRFVIEAIAPNVGYFTLTDYLYLIFLSSTFLVLIINVYELKKPLARDFKTGLYYGIQLFALGSYYLLTWS